MNLAQLGNTLQSKRESRGFSSSGVAKMLKVSAAYYSQLESGKVRPTMDRLNNLADIYGLPPEDRMLILQLAGHNPTQKDLSSNMPSIEPARQNEPQTAVQLDPQKHPVLYSDAMFVSISDNGVVFDFAQKVGPTDEQVVVSRIGVSYQHAEKIHKVLGEQIKRAKDMGLKIENTP